MPLTEDECQAIKDAAIAGLSSPSRMVRDGDQQVELRSPAELLEALGLCQELEDAAAGKRPGLVVVCPDPVTL